jgi:hypothetical protein
MTPQNAIKIDKGGDGDSLFRNKAQVICDNECDHAISFVSD